MAGSSRQKTDRLDNVAETSWNTIAIVGVGLIGGSLGLAIRRRGLARHVIGVGRHAERLQLAARLGAIDSWTLDLDEAGRRAQLVVVSTPVQLIATQTVQLLDVADASPPIVTDCGSVKEAIVDAVFERLPPERAARFVPAHPLAGSERTGVEHASSELFDRRVCVVTPTERTDSQALASVEQLWQAVGMDCVRLDPATHDRLLACTSHLPHVAASALVHALPDEAEPLVASGFLDTTRVAASSEEIWLPILRLNRERVLQALDRFSDALERARSALRRGDFQTLADWWRAARVRRERLGPSEQPAEGPTGQTE